MRVTILLADHAEVADGKLFVNGGGWDVTGPGPTTGSVAVLLFVPWDRANSPIEFVLKLVGEDGQDPFIAGSPQPFAASGQLEVGRPVGVLKGAELPVPVAISFGPLQLQANARYEWRLTVDAEENENWRLPFRTRP